MALVNYPSSSSEASGSESEAAREQPAKGHKSQPPDSSSRASSSATGRSVAAASASDMPPLPSTFYDLYASTVRQSIVDDPALHQGRKRQIPHVAGNWPSHLYVEWHPTPAQHDALVRLVDQVNEELGREAKLHTFLASDLGAPLPLHISLSRPMALSTADKGHFLERISSSIRSCGTGRFTVSPQRLAWYRSPDSNRTFLMLQVASGPAANVTTWPNPELMALLGVCNDVAALFSQPVLYQQKSKGKSVGEAFHISIGWTFGLAVDEASLEALRPFETRQFEHIRSWKIDVPGVKAKIGNAVSHIPLARDGDAREHSMRPSTSLFVL